MPTIIKNGRNYSGTSVSLTQAEYDALPEVTKMNGTTYFITDSDAMLEADEVGLGTGTVETLANSVAKIVTSPVTESLSVGQIIQWNGQTYEVTSAASVGESLNVGTNISEVTIGDEITALNNGLTSVQTLDGFIGYKDRTISNVPISYDNGYTNIGDIYSNWNIPTGAYLMSLYIRGWTGAPGLISLATSSDGRGVYVYCTKAGTISSLTVRIWYARF